MNICKAPHSQNTRRTTYVTALAVALAVALSQSAHAGTTPIVVPPAPAPGLQADADLKVFLVGHAVGTQNYVCSRAGAGVKYVLFTPEATLFDDDGKQIITHYFSPNPNPKDPNTSATVVADGAIRATWQDKDTSTIWAQLHPNGAATVDESAIAWLLLDVVGTEAGPTGGDKLTLTKQVQRFSTQGGLPPTTGCSTLDDAGNQAFVDYTADYFFYK
jgi:hypothetical protein